MNSSYGRAAHTGLVLGSVDFQTPLSIQPTFAEFRKVAYHSPIDRATPLSSVRPEFPGHGPWYGGVYTGDQIHLAPYFKLFISAASFFPGEGQHVRRFGGLHYLLLEVPSTACRITPTWEMQVFPGMVQTGFVLDTAQWQVSKAKALQRTAFQNGLTRSPWQYMDMLAAAPRPDDGRSLAKEELRHGKYQSRLTQWNPELRYSYEELLASVQSFGPSPQRPA